MPSRHKFQERRRYVRVDDDIVLSWREVKPDEIPDAQCHEHDPCVCFPLSSQIKLLSLETNELLQRIGQDNPVLVEYLKSLERRIDIIARSLAISEASSLCHTTRHVNLSAAGVAFISDTEFQTGVLLELKMILPPTLAGILAYGRVVDSTPNHDCGPTSYSLGVDFIRLRNRDRELLIQHVARRKALFRAQPQPH